MPRVERKGTNDGRERTDDAMSRLICGIDPGADGGIALMDAAGNVVETRRMPVFEGKQKTTDAPAVRDLILMWRDVQLVIVEKVGYLGGGERSGPQGFSTLARLSGLLEGLCVGLFVGYEEVAPRAWQKLVPAAKPSRPPKTSDRRADEKAAREYQSQWKREIIHAAQRRWPRADVKGSIHPSAGPHSGIADALWICEYGRLRVMGATSPSPKS